MTDFRQQQIMSVALKAVRNFFETQNLTEVVVPVLQSALPLEPNLYAFQTNWQSVNGETTYFLPTSPEGILKKYLANGGGNCFAIGHSFRNLEGAGPRHTPEFLMVEWYRTEAAYQRIQADVQDLILAVKQQLDVFGQQAPSSTVIYQGQAIDLTTEWPVLSLETLFYKRAGIHISDVTVDEKLLFTIAQQKGYDISRATWGQLFDQIFLNEIEPHLPRTVCVLVDFPKKLSPLCQANRQKPYLAERFEVLIGGIEIANGNTENTDYQEIFRAMKQEQQFRIIHQLSSHPIDGEFLEAMRVLSGKQLAGVGLGLERLLMVLTDQTSIA